MVSKFRFCFALLVAFAQCACFLELSNTGSSSAAITCASLSGSMVDQLAIGITIPGNQPESQETGCSRGQAINGIETTGCDFVGEISSPPGGGPVSGCALELRTLSDIDPSQFGLEAFDLASANLAGADLKNADLQNANLSGANLTGANLSGANLKGANLSNADLREAQIEGAEFEGAILDGTLF